MLESLAQDHSRLSTTLVVVVVSIIFCLQLSMVRSTCPKVCLCRWKGGKETTECVNKGLEVIPIGIDAGTQVLDMTGNNLQILPKEVFLRSGLLNLQRLHLSRCELTQVDRHAFSRLTNLVELDLSQNRLITIPTDSFINISDLRRLVFSGNAVERLKANSFAHLRSLVTLELTNCMVETIEDHAFDGLPTLQQLKLNGNRLRTLSHGVLTDLRSLTSILLTENPWKCDCQSREFRQWLLVSEVPYFISPQCSSPQRLKGFDLDKLILEDFACAPMGSAPYQLAQVQQGSNVTLECKVTADPEPFIHWLFQDTVITNGTESSQQSTSDLLDGRTYWVDESGDGTNDKVSSLFLGSVEERDKGHYVCVAENRGGRFLVNFTLEVTKAPIKVAQLPVVVNRGFLMGVIIGLSVFALLVLILVCVLLLKCCHSRRKRIRRQKLPRSETQETKGSSNSDSQNDALNEKLDMLHPANPIQKPPRSFANSTYVSTSQISLHDYGLLGNGGLGQMSGGHVELSREPHSGVYSIKPDIIKVDGDMGEYSVPRSQQQQQQQQLNGSAAACQKGSVGGGGSSSSSNGIYQNTGRWNNESPIATCHGCGDHTGSCLGVPCLHGTYSVDLDAESERSYRSNFRPTASGLAGETTEYNEEEWPRPPPPLYDTIKQPVPVWSTHQHHSHHGVPSRIDEGYELTDYPSNSSGANESGQVWERQSPTTAAAAAAVVAAASGSGCYSSIGGGGGGGSGEPFSQDDDDDDDPSQRTDGSSTNVHLKNSVPGLSPFPLLNLSTVRDSPDEGYEDEGEEGTEMPRVVKQKVKIKGGRL